MALKRKLISLFFDTNVFIAAAFSDKGASFKLLKYCLANRLTIIISRQVEKEIKQNLALLGKNEANRFEAILKIIKENTEFIMAKDPSLSEVTSAIKIIHKNDAPILAAAIKINPTYLITLNRKHFIKSKVIQNCSFKIMTPGWFMKKIKV